MNNSATLSHTHHLLPLVGTMSDGHVLVLTDDDADCEEITRTDIRVPSEDQDDSDWFQPTSVAECEAKSNTYASEDNWCDGLTIFALLLTGFAFIILCASDMGDKAAQKAERAHIDSCAVSAR